MWAYAPILSDTQDAVLTEDWDLTFAVLAGVFNGGLDRDNFADGAIVRDHIKKYACNRVYSDGGSWADPVSADVGTTDWQNGDSDGLPSVSEEAPVDTALVVHYSCAWTWDSSSGPTSTEQDRICVQWRLVVNGTTIAKSGWSPLQRARHHVYLVGASPIEAGGYTVRAQMRIARVTFNSATSNEDISSEGIGDFPLIVNGRELIVIEKRR